MLTILQVCAPARARAAVCTGHFVNPITDVCWDCLFPLRAARHLLAEQR
jgi:conjugal transfer pilus assembly protein TraU